jgi:serine protease AprX
MTLSGTSMAAAVVSGIAALILDENAGLTPNAVKAILMYSAEKRSEGYLDIGAGYVNALGAVNLAANINSNAGTSQYWLLYGGTKLKYASTIAGSPVVWSQTIVWSENVGLGNVLFYNQPAWATTIVWSESVPSWATTIVWSESVLANAIGGQTIVWEVMDTAVLSRAVLNDF